MNITDFVNKYKTYQIGDFTFREPTIKQLSEIREFYKDAMEKNIDEFEFYI